MREADVVTRQQVRDAVARYASGEMSSSSLAAWAFDQFYAYEAGQVQYEAGYEDGIAEVLDELMWTDEGPFTLNQPELSRLVAKLDAPPRPARARELDEDDGDDDELDD